MTLSRQALAPAVVIIAGMAGVALWAVRVDRQGVTASLVFDGVVPDTSDEFTTRAGGPMTAAELQRIESVARRELTAAFSITCVTLSDSPKAKYRIRVRQALRGYIAGHSRSIPGWRGAGEISFTVLTSNAVAYAPPDADRAAIVTAIGLGIGRTAAHELAHELLGSAPAHNPRDKWSYEYPDLRREHFYAPLHWTIAAAPLRSLYGSSSGGCRPPHR
jgi:hypothetical protein